MILRVPTTDIRLDTLRQVGPGIYFAFRKNQWEGGGERAQKLLKDLGIKPIHIQNGVWWKIEEDGSTPMVSLAYGASLHGWTSEENWDWETYDGHEICCHSSFADAEKCAISMLVHGVFCTLKPIEKTMDE